MASANQFEQVGNTKLYKNKLIMRSMGACCVEWKIWTT